jgi:hypothetical protein
MVAAGILALQQQEKPRIGEILEGKGWKGKDGTERAHGMAA